MGKRNARYCVRTDNGKWRIWNRKTARWWGRPSDSFPGKLVDELNGEKRPEKIVELTK